MIDIIFNFHSTGEIFKGYHATLATENLLIRYLLAGSITYADFSRLCLSQPPTIHPKKAEWRSRIGVHRYLHADMDDQE